MARDPTVSHYDRRRLATRRKLLTALERLQAEGGRLSVARLAREAKVARNAIYTNHLDIIKALEEAKVRRNASASLHQAGLPERQRAEIEALKEERRQLVTVNAALLKRALDAEAALAQAARRAERVVLMRRTAEG
jgi:hypothetical protein